MQRLLIAGFAFLLIMPAAWAQAGGSGGEKKEEKKGEKKADLKKEGKKKPHPEDGIIREKAKDRRLEIVLQFKGVSKRNQEKVIEALEKLSAIDVATADLAKREIKLKFADKSSCSLSAIQKGLKRTGAALDLPRIKFSIPITVHLAGAMKGTNRNEYRGKGRGWSYSGAQKSLRDFKKVTGLKASQWTGPTDLKLIFKDPVKLSVIAAIVAKHGSNQTGSNKIKDVSWEGRKIPERKPRKQPRKTGKKGTLK